MTKCAKYKARKVICQNTLQCNFLLKYKLHQQHITNRPSRYGKQHLTLPHVQGRHHRNTDKLRYSAASRKQIYVFQTIYNQQTEYCRRKNPTKVPYILRSRFSCRKKEEWEKSGQYRPKHHHANCNYPLYSRHRSALLPSPPIIQIFHIQNCFLH